MKIAPELGVCYYPEHWPEHIWIDDASRMKKAGLSWVRIAEFSWSKLEPSEGIFNWPWLDRAIDVLGSAGLKIVIGTPSATPPKWVCKKYPDIFATDVFGNSRKFGSRRHYCFSHIGYRGEVVRLAKAMAKRYGENQHVRVWQIDNEYGCHETTISYSESARLEFRKWLLRKYQTVDMLNRAWGNIFWSMEYASFADIDLPNLTVTEANPSHWIDFYRFSSDQVVAFNVAQVETVRRHTSRPLVHNFMGRVSDFDHFAVGNSLEIASWDSYPLGFLEHVLNEENDASKLRYCEQGDPDFQAFHHDLYRSVGRGRWWVMEQQLGPVNWAVYNPIPLQGMVKLWTMEAIAHGAEVVSYFRWRQIPFAQEQMHSGLLHTDGSNSKAMTEVNEVVAEIRELGEIETIDSDVAIVFDYESQWAWEIQPQGKRFDYFRLVFEQYRALRKLGLSVDILSANVESFGNRKLVLIPGLMSWNKSIDLAISTFKGIILAGPRSGLKTKDLQIPESLGANFAGAKTYRVSTLRPNKTIQLDKGGCVINWFEELECKQTAEYTIDGRALLAREGMHLYLGGWLDQNGFIRIFDKICQDMGIDTFLLIDGVRRRRTKNCELIVNYNSFEIEFDCVSLSAAGYIWR